MEELIRRRLADDECSLQLEELIRAVASQDDFDLAYHLQLQEAIAASAPPHTHRQHLSQPQAKEEEPTVCASSSDDRALALALQNEELYRSQLQEQDYSLMSQDMEQLRLEIKRRSHDAAFAKSLMGMDDVEWEARGGLHKNPFNPHSNLDSTGATATATEPALFCRLYVTVASSESNMLFAMGAVILDSQNLVLTELKKSFAPGTSKSTADYMALIMALQIIHAMGFQHIEAHTDSILLYNQVTDRWRVRTRKMQELWSQVREYAHNLPAFHMFLEPRNMNQHAMRLAREAVSGGGASASKSGTQLCSICLELKHHTEMVKVSACGHDFCNTCVVQHTEVKVQSGKVPVCCPQFGCNSVLSLDQCQSILSQRWFDLLKKRLIEAKIPESERVYCPYLHCSALMDRRDLIANVTSLAASSSTATTRKMCVDCARFFCMECRVPWHTSMSCGYYQKLPPELRDKQDAELHQLAENQKWQRCKKCRRMIELSEGCYHMTCRCGYEFCYLCGEEWKGKAETCKCRLWDEGYLLRQPAPVVNNEMNLNLVEGFEADSDDDMDFDDVDGRSNFLFVSDPVNPYYKTKLCRHWVRGVCFSGDHCNFAHGPHELR